MPKADRVLSTPPTNTPISQVDATSRRRFLTNAAGVAAGGSVLALATIPPALAANAPAGSPDPIPAAIDDATDPAFAVIAEKLAADAAHDEAIDVQAEAESRYGFSSEETYEASQRSAEKCRRAHEVGWKLATTTPTSFAGVAAVLRFANEIEDAGNEWPDTETSGPEGWHYQLRATMAAAIEALSSAEKAVTS
jgi:hypothetical protein